MKLEPDLLIGAGKYKLTCCLGYGGQAEVWEAEQQGLAGFSKPIVLKLVTPDRRGDQRLYQNLLREAQLSSLLHHPNIAEVYDVGEDDGILYIAMERIKGKDLEHILERCLHQTRTPIPWHLAVLMVADVCKGLHHVHTMEDSHGDPLHLVHRDLKPSNLLLSQEGFVKVIDFGVAKAANSTQVTRQGAVRGTPAYMAPEQIRSLPTDGRADLFAMGAVLYELTTGQRAFLDEDLFALFYAVMSKTPKAPTLILPSLPKGLEQIITKAMAKSPNNRFQNAREMHQALIDLLREHKHYPEPSDLAALYGSLVHGNETALSIGPKERSGHRTGHTLSYGNSTQGPQPLSQQKDLSEVAPHTLATSPQAAQTPKLEQPSPANPEAAPKAPSQPDANRPRPPKFIAPGQPVEVSSPTPTPIATPQKQMPAPTERQPQPTERQPTPTKRQAASNTTDTQDEVPVEERRKTASTSSAAQARPTLPPPPFFGPPKEALFPPKTPKEEKEEVVETTRSEGFLAPSLTPSLVEAASLGESTTSSPYDTQQMIAPDLSTDPDIQTDDLVEDPVEVTQQSIAPKGLHDTQKIELPPEVNESTTLPDATPIPRAPFLDPTHAQEKPALKFQTPASLGAFAAMLEQESPKKLPEAELLAFPYPPTNGFAPSHSIDELPDVFAQESELEWGWRLDDGHRRIAMIVGAGLICMLAGALLFIRSGAPTPAQTLAPSIKKAKAHSSRTSARMSSWQTFEVSRDTPKPRVRRATPRITPMPQLPKLLPPRQGTDPILLPLPDPRSATEPKPPPATVRPAPAPPARPPAMGSVRFRITPSCTLYAGRQKLGASSRVTLQRRPGRYSFRCINRSAKLSRQLTVRIKAGRRTTLRIRYRKGKLFVVSYPWSLIELPPFGKIGYSQAAISLWEGRYTLRLYQQGKRHRRKTLRVRIRPGRITKPAVIRW